MVEVILQRKKREARYELQAQLKIAEVHAKTLGTLLSGLAQSKKSAKAIESAAGKISFDLTGKKKEKKVPSTSAVMAMMGVRPNGQIGAR